MQAPPRPQVVRPGGVGFGGGGFAGAFVEVKGLERAIPYLQPQPNLAWGRWAAGRAVKRRPAEAPPPELQRWETDTAFGAWSPRRGPGWLGPQFTRGGGPSTLAERLGRQTHRPRTVANLPGRLTLPLDGGRLTPGDGPQGGPWPLLTDLLAYAPGLTTTEADVQAVLEAEAPADLAHAPGRLDPAARALIDWALQAGWQPVTVPEGEGVQRPPARRKPGGSDLMERCDGAGRFAFVHRTPEGLRERVVGDGRTLWHLYPELGPGALRTFSHFHAADLQDLVPWLVPSAEDLARGADVTLIGERTVAVVPRPAGAEAPPALHLIFGAEGRLIERREVGFGGAVLARETYAADGRLSRYDGAGKLLGEHRFRAPPAAAPDLAPDVSDLVILPQPYRSRQHWERQGPAPTTDEGLLALPRDRALSLLAAMRAERGYDPRNRLGPLIAVRFTDRGDHRLGFSTLLMRAYGSDLKDCRTKPCLASGGVSRPMEPV